MKDVCEATDVGSWSFVGSNVPVMNESLEVRGSNPVEVLFQASPGYAIANSAFITGRIIALLDFIERVVIIECRKTKTRVITLTNQKGRRQSGKPIKTRSNDT